MKIGLIGPKSSCESIKKSILDIDCDILVKSYFIEKIKDSSTVIEQCDLDCDAIIFSGCAVESSALLDYTPTKPYIHISKSNTSIMEAFMKMQKRGKSLDRFSVDIIKNQSLDDLFDELEMDSTNYYTFPFLSSSDENKYLDWHLSLFNQNKIDIALTSLEWVYKELKAQGYEVFYLKPTKTMVREALEKLKLKTNISKAEYFQISVEILQLTNYEEKEGNYYSNMLKKLQVEKDIIEYVKKLQGSLFNFGRNEYMIFTNRGIAKDKSNYLNLKKLQKKTKKEGIIINAGIGVGETVYSAELNARKALDNSLRLDNQDIYLSDGDNIIYGPLGVEDELDYNLIESNNNIEKIIESTGICYEYIAKIISVCNSKKNNIFDANEIADILDISVRSARRIVNKLIENGYADICKKERSLAGGRPKSYIEMLF